MNRSVLFSIVQRVSRPMTGGAFDAIEPAGLERTAAAVRAIRAGVAGAGAGAGGSVDGLRVESRDGSSHRREEAARTQRELDWAAGAMLLACELGLRRIEQGRERPMSELPAAVRGKIRDTARELGEELRRVWLARHRPGGLDASIEWWSRIERALEPRSGSTTK
jgi:hypothetical protein